VHLIRSGKLSVKDATDAVDAIKKDSTNAAKKKTTSAKDGGKQNKKPQAKHRTLNTPDLHKTLAKRKTIRREGPVSQSGRLFCER
jgi:hypothetical protein